MPDDITFTNDSLETYDGMRVLKVYDALPGGFTVVDDNGSVVIADQMEVFYGENLMCVAVIMDEWLVDGALQGTWRIRYNRGARGQDGLSATVSDASLDEMMLYAMIFG